MHQRIQLAISAVLVLFFLVAASRGLGENTSYWADELWSVSASRADWGVMLRDWLIPDTHPPSTSPCSSSGSASAAAANWPPAA